MTRSRLRRPTSKSIATVLWPSQAMPAAMFALVVVLPTPPLPEVTTMTFDTCASLAPIRGQSVNGCQILCAFFPRSSPGCLRSQRRDPARAAVQVDLRRPPPPLGGDVLGRQVRAGDGDQLGLQPLAEDARARQTLHAGHGAAAQRRIDV